MEKRTFGQTGLEVSTLGFGSAPIGFLATDQKRVSDMLNRMLDLGVNVIDTAAAYAGSEESVGKAVAHRRDEYVLISKCGMADDELEGAPWSTKLIEQTIDRALRRLQTDRLDAMLLHSCSLETLERGEALTALANARDAGKVRFVGYSGDNEAAAVAAELNDVAVIETSVNLCDQANIDLVLPRTVQQKSAVIAKRPLANAAWKKLSDQPGFYAGYAETYTRRLALMNLTPADLGFDGPPETAWPEIALRFALSFPSVHTAIVGTTNPDHFQANLAAAAKGPLPEEAVETLRKAFQNGEAQAKEEWIGQT